MQHKQQRKLLGLLSIYEWAIIAMVVVILIGILYPAVRGGNRSPVLRSASKMRSLAQALIIYSTNHGDVFPAQAQYPSILLEMENIDDIDLVSPVEKNDVVSYFYVPGPCDFDDKQILLYEDPSHWEMIVIVCFADAHVEAIDKEAFERMLAEQLAAQSEPP